MCIWNCKVEDRHCELCLYSGECEREAAEYVEDNSAADVYVKTMNEIVGGDIRVPSRESAVLWGRNFVMYELRCNGYSTLRIGRIVKRHHTTVIHGARSAQNAMEHPKSYADAMLIWNSFVEKLSLHKTITV